MLSSPATITPADGGAGGSFTPAQVSLTTTSPMASFTYTAPATAGAVPLTLAVTPQNLPGTRWDLDVAAEITTYGFQPNGAAVFPAGKASDLIILSMPPHQGYFNPPGANTITLSDGGVGGTFSSNNVLLWAAKQFTCLYYMAPAAATGQMVTLSATHTRTSVQAPSPIVGRVLPPATTYTVSGPSLVPRGVPTPLTVSLPPNTAVSGPIVILASDGWKDSLVRPAEIQLTNQQPTTTFWYTPAMTGPMTLTFTNSSTSLSPPYVVLTDPAPFALMSVELDPATTFTLTPPSPAAGAVQQPSGPFTVALPAGTMVHSPVTITPGDDRGGTFTPARVCLSNDQPQATFTYTPCTAGTGTISCLNDGGLDAPARVTYTVQAPVLARPLRYIRPRRRVAPF